MFRIGSTYNRRLGESEEYVWAIPLRGRFKSMKTANKFLFAVFSLGLILPPIASVGAQEVNEVSGFFEFLSKTPVDTLFILFGLIMLSIGFGLRFRAVIDVKHVNPLFAKIAGLSFLVLGLILKVESSIPVEGSQTEPDPFIGYYLIIVPLVVILCWVPLKYAHGKMQLLLLKSTFAFIGALLTIAVFWRAVDVYFYLKSPGNAPLPMGLYAHSSYIPYFALIGSGVSLIAWSVFHYTREARDKANRLPALGYFAVFCIYLIVCRLGWEIVDYVAPDKIPALPT